MKFYHDIFETISIIYYILFHKHSEVSFNLTVMNIIIQKPIMNFKDNIYRVESFSGKIALI